MEKLKNTIVEKMHAQNKVSHVSLHDSYNIYLSITKNMKEYAREYSKKEKASHIAASKVLLTS